ncbi:vanadium-dependent haloperoxidase [Aquimarina agarivorans]|uniref:vanadium-dependent haloperoxidase n=1 Tax=Aquimarina agarivorans TaxID=980584 RepID=UPI000248F2C8|nr:vanadium-dependent haloperoxidase [Aquimarina agarivorans]
MATDNNYTPTEVQIWNRLTCDAIHYVGMPPTVASRALAMVHTAMYDAWTNYNDSGDEVSTTTGKRLQRPNHECTLENREKAYSHAAFTVLQALFWIDLPAEKKYLFRDFMCQLSFDADDKNLEPDNPAGLGNLCGRLILESRAGDGANQYATLEDGRYKDFTNYRPANPPVPQPLKNIDRWQPQLVGHQPQTFITAHWGLVKPFALTWAGQYRPSSPFDCNETRYKLQAEEVLVFSESLTDKQKLIAEFWAGMHEDKFEDSPKDGQLGRRATPPEQCCRQARYLSKKYGHKNSFDIKMFFALSNALLDAGIAAWDAKVHYDYVRPISAIRALYRGKTIKAWGGPSEGTKAIEGENWVPYIPTPPFAEYVSGHSTFSAAAEEVLSSFCDSSAYGETVTIAKGGSKIEPDFTPEEAVTLCWDTLKNAADEAGISRLYGGIHFKSGDIEGRELGRKVGCEVWNKVCQYFNADLG